MKKEFIESIHTLGICDTEEDDKYLQRASARKSNAATKASDNWASSDSQYFGAMISANKKCQIQPIEFMTIVNIGLVTDNQFSSIMVCIRALYREVVWSKLSQSRASSFLLHSIEGLNGANFFAIGSVYLIKTAFFGLFE